jgi:hypothetical protein
MEEEWKGKDKVKHEQSGEIKGKGQWIMGRLS